MTASLGRFRITEVKWAGLTAIAVSVATTVGNRHFQLYAGRRMIGVTSSAAQNNRVVGQLVQAHCPHSLILVMVNEADRLTDFGRQLPRRPLNQFEIGWEANDFPADTKWFEIAAATAPETEVDPDNVVARMAYLGDGAYQFILDPIDAPGSWGYLLTPRDDAVPRGNAGTPAEVAMYALPYPPDTAIAEDGTRLTASVEDGLLTVGFAYDWIKGGEG